ncbi:hypothetical protein EDD21DRAFT_356608 [Dissophora ornata]|nr:hypothetical protein EDD21DRAFT_356608 [Dissophora ornata]
MFTTRSCPVHTVIHSLLFLQLLLQQTSAQGVFVAVVDAPTWQVDPAMPIDLIDRFAIMEGITSNFKKDIAGSSTTPTEQQTNNMICAKTNTQFDNNDETDGYFYRNGMEHWIRAVEVLWKHRKNRTQMLTMSCFCYCLYPRSVPRSVDNPCTTVPICAPAAGDVWIQDSLESVIWSPTMMAPFGQYDMVDAYIVDDVPIPATTTTLTTTLSASTTTKKTTTLATTTMGASATSTVGSYPTTLSASSEDPDTLSPLVIGVISAGSVALVIALIALGLLVSTRRRFKGSTGDFKSLHDHPGSPTDDLSKSSIFKSEGGHDLATGGSFAGAALGGPMAAGRSSSNTVRSAEPMIKVAPNILGNNSQSPSSPTSSVPSVERKPSTLRLVPESTTDTTAASEASASNLDTATAATEAQSRSLKGSALSAGDAQLIAETFRRFHEITSTLSALPKVASPHAFAHRSNCVFRFTFVSEFASAVPDRSAPELLNRLHEPPGQICRYPSHSVGYVLPKPRNPFWCQSAEYISFRPLYISIHIQLEVLGPA